MTKLAVVVLNWNAAADTASCLRAIRAWGLIDQPEVWVVDNGSEQPEVAAIRRGFPESHVIQSPVNRGFSGGSNLGIEAALGRGTGAVLLLNNDASVDGSSVTAMLETLGCDPAIGVIGPTLWHDGRCISAGGRDIALHAATRFTPLEPPTALFDVDYVPGTVALIRREVFEAVGILDEDFFFGGEMADFCHRARMAGYRSVTEPRARALHDLDRSSRERAGLHLYYVFRNRFLFVRKHHRERRAQLYARWALRGARTALAALARGDARMAKVVTLGVLDGVRGRVGGRDERALT
jgi:hypothetical protein